ncbi:MAG: YfdX family protein [Methylococcaceae bacterium]
MKTFKFTKQWVILPIVLSATFGIMLSVSAAITPSASAILAMPELKQALVTKRELLDEKHKEIEFETFGAVNGARNALLALKKNDSKLAMEMLLDTIRQLNVLRAKFPQDNLIPAIIDADIYDFDSDAKHVENIVKNANTLLNEDRVQDARELLNQLVSEIHVTTISVPLGSFLAGVNDAAYFINGGDIAKAEDVLHEVLNRLVKTVEIMPLPVLKAEKLLVKAAQVEKSTENSPAERNSEIQALSDTAKEKLNLAEMLGYGAKEDYVPLNDAIDVLQSKVSSGQSQQAWNTIATNLLNLKEKLTRVKK